jgi:hypothetical protein
VFRLGDGVGQGVAIIEIAREAFGSQHLAFAVGIACTNLGADSYGARASPLAIQATSGACRTLGSFSTASATKVLPSPMKLGKCKKCLNRFSWHYEAYTNRLKCACIDLSLRKR